MSSAPSRIQPMLGRAVRGIAWIALFAALAAGSAGLIAEASHAPGSPARADLTYTADAALNARLDEATLQLESISRDVDTLAEAAKSALEEIASDPAGLQEDLRLGNETADAINVKTRSLLDSLATLPGAEPDAAVRFSNDALVRRAAIIAALEAASSLNLRWQQVTGKAAEASELTALIAQHDETVLAAAGQGKEARYAEAAATLDAAILALVDITTQREKLIADQGPTVLDEWIQRNRDYDAALKALYVALNQSGGKVTAKVQLARRDEREALKRLPADGRAMIVIVAEVARGGLTQAVLSIEDARGRIDEALAEAGGVPGASPGPGESGAPEESPLP